MIVSKTRSIRFTSNENLKKNIGEIKNIIDSYSCITIIEDSIFGVSEENFGQPLTLTFTIEVSSDEELEIDLWGGIKSYL